MNNVVIITGGSRGIGAATAILFAGNNYHVCINYKSDVESANKVATQVRNFGVKCICVQADVSKEQEVIRLFDQVDEHLGELTALVNNAGIIQTQMRLDEMDEQRINHILTTNITSYFL